MPIKEKESVTIIEVGPRDGLQNLKKEIPTIQKLTMINHLVDSGIKRIEASSFVSPKWTPQFKDACELFTKIKKDKNVSYSALIPNEKGFDNALKCGVEEVVFVIVASDSLNRENFNKNTSESLKELSIIGAKAKASNIRLRGIIGGSFGCPFEGEVPVDRVIEIALALKNYGVFEISLADSIGIANPYQVKKVLFEFLQQISSLPISVHFHNTREVGIANVYAAFEVGIKIFESSITGLGGCPYAPGAPGNVSTESLVHLFNGMGVETGINMEKLLISAEYVNSIIK